MKLHTTPPSMSPSAAAKASTVCVTVASAFLAGTLVHPMPAAATHETAAASATRQWRGMPPAAQAVAPRWGSSTDVAHYVPHSDAPSALVRTLGSRTMAVWERGAGPGTTVLRMSSQRPDGHWTRPQTLASSPASYLHTYDLELGPHGTALVVWSYGDNVTHVMETHREGGSWSTPRQLNGHNGDVPDGTIDGQGVMTVAWQGYGSRGSTLVITARPPGGDWARPRALSEHGGYPTVASNQDGDVAVAWGVDRGAEVFLKKAGEPWSPVKTLISGFWPAYVDLLVAPDGRALALWSLDPDGDVAKKRHLAWAQTDLDGTWSDVGFLDTRDVPTWGTEQSVSMNSDGEVFALWQASSAHSEPYKTAYFDFDTGWTSPKFFAGWRYCCLMNTWLSDTGTAVAIFGPKGSSRTASWAYRTPGQRWQKADMNPTTLPIPYAVDGDGERLVLLQFKPNLQSRTLVLPPPPTRTT